MSYTALLVALEDFMEARADYRFCVDTCTASPGYYCQRYRDRMEETEKRFVSALNDHIDNRIEAATGARP